MFYLLLQIWFSIRLVWSINLFHIGAHFASILNVVNKSFVQSSNIFFQYFLSQCFSFPHTVTFIASYLHCLAVYISALDAGRSLADPPKCRLLYIGAWVESKVIDKSCNLFLWLAVGQLTRAAKHIADRDRERERA